MRNKIDYGIDLGTTNSAIARMENGVPVIKKSDTLKDTFPSCIHFNKKKDIIVGDAAYNVMRSDSARALKTFEKGQTNTFIEFKRTMGTTHTYESSNMGKSFSSEELSAEILKTLKSVIKDENFSSVVITVPAKFLNPQNEATIKAAKLLGFKQVQLLQEPVAAATAYGLGTKNKDGFWLVFDFGGGTFDAALLKAEDGILTVKDTDGDNWLGGKNLDDAIVDQIIIPNIQENFSIENVLNDPIKKELLRAGVKRYAEDAKIQLSFKESYNILSELGDLQFADDNDEEPEIDVLVTQAELESVLSPIFQKSIDITKELLKRNNLKGSDLGALILVGGPTYSPILRRMLKQQITEKVDTSVDPMTVVAQGAALFASTISVDEDVKDETRDNTKIQLELKYEATTVDQDAMVNLKILKEKSSGNYQGKVFADLVRSDGAFSTGKKAISEKASIVEVLLVEGRSNSFQVILYDEQGNQLESQPNQFSILQGIGGLEGMQVLTYHIGISKYFSEEEKDLFLPVKGLEKNKQLPATGVINGLKTRNQIRPGMVNDIIRIPIYQGDYEASGTNPVLNNFVNEVIITGESLPGLLPEDSDVDITIKIDKSQVMQFSAYFPLLNHTEELQVEIKSTEPPKESELLREIKKAKSSARQLDQSEVSESLDQLEAQLENEKGSADGKMKILDGLRKELLKIDSSEKSAQWPAVEKELRESFYELEDLLEKIKANSDGGDLNMDKLDAYLLEYRKATEQIIAEKNIKEGRKLIREIGSTDFQIRNAVTGNGLDIEYLNIIDNNFNNYHWKDPNKARQLINQGLQVVSSGRTTALRPILVQIIDLMPDDEKDKTGTLR